MYSRHKLDYYVSWSSGHLSLLVISNYVDLVSYTYEDINVDEDDNEVFLLQNQESKSKVNRFRTLFYLIF